MPVARFVATGLCIVATLTALPASAQTFPSKPVRLVVGFPPGGESDIIARLVGQKLGESLGQAVVVENRPGASGTVAAAAVAKAAPDGYTLFFVTSGHSVNTTLFTSLPYDAGEDFAAVSAVAIAPVSAARREVSINATRVANLDATDTEQLSAALTTLYEQVVTCMGFLKKRLPGFADAAFSGVAPRIGIRETRRVMGDYVLTGDDVLASRRHPDAIAQGGHEIDIHAAGTAHDRRIIEGGGSYDVPFGALIPRGLNNLLVAGRCLSSTREGQSSARVMGTCMAMGQAAGTAAAISAKNAVADGRESGDVRALPVARLRETLRDQGALLSGTS